MSDLKRIMLANLTTYKQSLEGAAGKAESLLQEYNDVGDEGVSVSLDWCPMLNESAIKEAYCKEILKKHPELEDEIDSFVSTVVERNEHAEYGWRYSYDEFSSDEFSNRIEAPSYTPPRIDESSKQSASSFLDSDSPWIRPASDIIPYTITNSNERDSSQKVNFRHLLTSSLGFVDSDDISYESCSYTTYLNIKSPESKFESELSNADYDLRAVLEPLQEKIENLEYEIENLEELEDDEEIGEFAEEFLNNFDLNVSVSQISEEELDSEFFEENDSDIAEAEKITNAYSSEISTIQEYELKIYLAELSVKELVSSYDDNENYTDYVLGMSYFEDGDFVSELEDHLEEFLAEEAGEDDDNRVIDTPPSTSAPSI